jgi:Glycosyltransferase family 20
MIDHLTRVVLDTVNERRLAAPQHGQRGAGLGCVLGEPGPQRGDCARGERGDAVLAAFAVAGDIRACAEMDIAAGQAGELGGPQPGLDRQQDPGVVAAAAYLAADVMLVTSLRDGMNLVAKKYVRDDDTGALVLSEFTGAADELRGAFLVNPHDIEGMKDAIVRAATVPPPEARRRMRAMQRRVREFDVSQWAASFLGALQRASEPS